MIQDAARTSLPTAFLLSLLVLTGCAEDELPTAPATDRPAPIDMSGAASVTVLEVLELETLGGELSEASDVNDLDWIVGMSSTDGGYHATLWQAGVVRDLTVEAGFTRATAVSNTGWLAGVAGNEAIRWNESAGPPELLGVPGSLSDSWAIAVNNAGHIAGGGLASVFRPLKWTDHWHSWQVEGGGEDINDADRMVGWARVDGWGTAVVWAWDDWMVPLGTLGGDPESIALGINNLIPAQIVGASISESGSHPRAFIRNDGTMTELHALSGAGGWGEANDINEAGYVVGASQAVAGGPLRATLWTPEGEAVDLGGLGDGTEDRIAYAINNKGTVVGISWISGEAHATVWHVDIPEPSPNVLDTDGDGIVDAVDTDPLTPSDAFSDEGVGGSTTGWITERGYQYPRVTDEPDPLGIRIKTYARGSWRATVSHCDDHAIVWYGPGSEAIVTCGSVDIKAIAATVDILLIAWNDASAWVDMLPAGNGLSFDPEAATITAYASNTVDLLIFTELGDVFLKPGETIQITESQPPTENQPPVADAGSDQTVECTGNSEAEITLDGSASSDPDGDVLTYTWRLDGEVIGQPTTDPTAQVTLGLGTHTIELIVEDGNGGSDTDEVEVTVEDTQAPTIAMTVDPAELWPPNHKMVLVAAGVSASDACCDVMLAVDVVSNEPEDGTGDGSTDPDWQVVDLGDGTFDVYVRAERAGGGDGRVYTITATASDSEGNATTSAGTVTVPHDRGGKKGKG
ncbi:MAG: hypothetical protein JSV86_16620 [Gemmatimonadota bacterium]|nr:MAG: hypothetical protein JSV86_16620 [Gemmatimonadota bacterium]